MSFKKILSLLEPIFAGLFLGILPYFAFLHENHQILAGQMSHWFNATLTILGIIVWILICLAALTWWIVELPHDHCGGIDKFAPSDTCLRDHSHLYTGVIAFIIACPIFFLFLQNAAAYFVAIVVCAFSALMSGMLAEPYWCDPVIMRPKGLGPLLKP